MRIGVLAFEGISPFHLSVPCIVFGEERGADAAPRFDLRVCAGRKQPLRTSAGFTITAAHGLRTLERSQIVIVPSWYESGEAAPPAVLQALRRAHARGAIVVGLCLGAYVLAQAGLLDDLPATTHWQWVDDFTARHPQVRMQPDVLYVDGGNVLTSAGVAAGIDCCLHLLRRLCGAEVANRAARRMVAAPHRQGGQAQYVAAPITVAPERDPLKPLLEWLVAHLDETHALDALAARVAMSRRTLTRRFRDSTGTTVGRWLLHQRLALAQRLLESGDRSIEAVAAASGFGSAGALRQQFRAAFRVSPSDYRRQFTTAAAPA